MSEPRAKIDGMTDMTWALEVASQHPDLQGAIVTEDGDWLDVLLADGRTFRFRPFALIDQDAPDEVQRSLLDRLITIGAADASPAPSEQEADALGDALDHSQDPLGDSTEEEEVEDSRELLRRGLIELFGTDFTDATLPGPRASRPDTNEVSVESVLVPIVRPASYFIRSLSAETDDSFIYVPVTEFVGVGIAADTPDSIIPVRFSDLELHRTDYPAGILFKRAVDTLRDINTEEGHPGVVLQAGEIAGANVTMFMSPESYQSSWFADIEIVHKVAQMVTDEDPESIPLFVPATRTSFFVVRDTDPRLPALFRYLAHDENTEETIYPLPHTIAADGWREWIPLPDHPAARVLSKLRSDYRARIYDAQQSTMIQWPADLGQIQSASPVELSTGTVTVTRWTSSFGYGSVPDTDFISFVDDNATPDAPAVVLRLSVARQLWPEGFTQMEGIWPRRWAITGFPSAEALDRMRAQAGRAF